MSIKYLIKLTTIAIKNGYVKIFCGTIFIAVFAPNHDAKNTPNPIKINQIPTVSINSGPVLSIIR